MDTKHRETYEFLNEHKLGVLSTVGEQGEPWGAAVYYVVTNELEIYFLTHATSKKYKNLAQKAAAALTVVDDYKQTTVQMSGTIDELEMGEEHDMAFQKLAQVRPPGQFAWAPPVSKIHDGSVVLLKLTPTTMRYSRFKSDEDGETYIVDVL